nr:MAG TPA: hypothetical protein [Caudoviricetes sp.]
MKMSIKKSRTAAANDCTGRVFCNTMKTLSVYHGLLPNASVGEVIFWKIKIFGRFGP